MKVINKLQHAWNAFFNKDPTPNQYGGYSYANRPDRIKFTGGNERSIVSAVYNRLALDAANINIRHIYMDKDGRFTGTVESNLNDCLTLSANIDQTARSFIQDVVISMFDEGCVAILPVDTTMNPNVGAFDVCSMRTGKIIEWYPSYIKVRVYDEQHGCKRDLLVSKNIACIIENPFYSVMNERNSTLQRLIHKLTLLDAVDEQTSSGKLDMLIQLPYQIKTEARKRQAEDRRKSIEDQLTGSKYGIAYIDGTEHVTQLNRPLENNLMKQIEYLTNLLFSQLGITQSILDGTADDKTMLNYYNRTIEPIVAAITDEMKRKFLSKTARTRGQTIHYFRDPFKLVPVSDLADIADTLTRNEIASSNEIRQIMGWMPSSDPRADELINSNISQSKMNNTQARDDPGQNVINDEVIDNE